MGVQVGQWLVQQQHRRGYHQRARQGHPLALATGEFAGIALGVLAQMHQAQGLLDAAGEFSARHLAHAQAEGDVVAHRHVREQRIALKDHPEAAAGRLGVGDVLAVEQDAPAADLDEAGDHLQGGGLAAAGGAEQGDEFAALDGQGRTGHRVAVAVALAEIVESQESHGRNAPPVAPTGTVGKVLAGRKTAWIWTLALARMAASGDCEYRPMDLKVRAT